MTCEWTWNEFTPFVCQKWVFIFLISTFDCRRWNFVPVKKRLTSIIIGKLKFLDNNLVFKTSTMMSRKS